MAGAVLRLRAVAAGVLDDEVALEAGDVEARPLGIVEDVLVTVEDMAHRQGDRVLVRAGALRRGVQHRRRDRPAGRRVVEVRVAGDVDMRLDDFRPGRGVQRRAGGRALGDQGRGAPGQAERGDGEGNCEGRTPPRDRWGEGHAGAGRHRGFPSGLFAERAVCGLVSRGAVSRRSGSRWPRSWRPPPPGAGRTRDRTP
ncbi:hypothetical protein SDC9_173768 [bioreactor metagenome]|uniref:Uncharacterized protein n=1 Tax=bioreactor metagenome TaxID=1076179 RepID=A0A645GQV7_9ZZZZ